jgi:hypothetical protein
MERRLLCKRFHLPYCPLQNKDGVSHLIFAEAWNHVQIMNLDTRQVLTASKSLIEENAEERHLEFYKEHREDNKLTWPRPYDYFFGKLFVSPNQQTFLSAGWVWGSLDCYTVYNIENFITNSKIVGLGIGGWEHENRPTCWVDNETIAVVYNPFSEGDENSTANTPCEIHFHKICGNNVEIEKKIQLADKSILPTKMYFNTEMNSFITVSDNAGLSVILQDGQIAFKDEHLMVNEYSVETGFFMAVHNNTLSIYELTA